MDAYRAIVDKRDQRLFLPRPLPDEPLRRILQAARMTGSSKNAEPNRLVVVREPARVAAVGAISPWGRWLSTAAAVIVIVQTEAHEFDAGRCAQNMMLAAWNDGVVSCPNGIADASAAAEGLELREGEEIAIVLSFGYPERPRDPQRREAAEWSARANRKPLDELEERR